MVHGGYDIDFDLETDQHRFLKFDDYNTKSRVNDKTTIVGHWPACLLRQDQLTNLPYFNHEKNIIFIDGGMGVKKTCELNALIIKKIHGTITYDCIQANDFEKKYITHELRFQSEPLLHISYPHYAFDILEKGQELTRCRHKHSQQEFSIINDLIVLYEDQWMPTVDYVNQFFNLPLKTPVEVCDHYGLYTMVKYKDQYGWIKSHQIL